MMQTMNKTNMKTIMKLVFVSVFVLISRHARRTAAYNDKMYEQRRRGPDHGQTGKDARADFNHKSVRNQLKQRKQRRAGEHQSRAKPEIFGFRNIAANENNRQPAIG